MAKPPPSDIPDPRLRCPKDATLMEKMRIGDLTVDHCAPLRRHVV